MGTSGVSVFADDFALDVREAYLKLLTDGVDDAKATRRMIRDFATADVDEGPVFWVALAATQWEYGRLDATVKKRALKAIDQGTDLERWTESKSRQKRKAVLAALREKLLSQPPSPRMPRRRQTVEVPSRALQSPDRRWTATAFEIGDRTGRLGQVMVETKSGGGGVFAADCAFDAIKLRWIDSDTLEITHPRRVRIEKKDDSYFHRGKTIKILYQRD
jgi:hypothetical protein